LKKGLAGADFDEDNQRDHRDHDHPESLITMPRNPQLVQEAQGALAGAMEPAGAGEHNQAKIALTNVVQIDEELRIFN
jgi:hypothetical protein